jgi:hypothetical protein
MKRPKGSILVPPAEAPTAWEKLEAPVAPVARIGGCACAKDPIEPKPYLFHLRRKLRGSLIAQGRGGTVLAQSEIQKLRRGMSSNNEGSGKDRT